MTATNQPRRRAERLGRRLGIAAFLAVAPKCLACALAYAGLFGLGGVELCGGTRDAEPPWLAAIAGSVAVVVFLFLNRGKPAGSITP